MVDDDKDDEGANAVPPAAPAEEHEPRRSLVPEVVRRAIERGIEAGLGTLTRTDDVLRGVVGDVKLPKEVVAAVFSGVDDTKNALLKAVATEVREFLQATDLATEMQKALTSLSFEIKTEIRFIPNDAGTGVKPSVRMGQTTVRRNDTAKAGSPPDVEAPHDGSAHDTEAPPPRRGLRRRR